MKNDKPKQKKQPATKSKTKKPAAPKVNKQKVIKELATHFEADLNKTIPLSIQPDGSIVYKEYYVKKTNNEMWNLINLNSHDIVDQYYLKTSAVMAAKAYSKANLTKFFEIKQLDNSYWACYSNSLVYEKNIKKAKEFDRFVILLNKLELSREQTEEYKDKISTMFRWSFV
jgi:hypothetical protein